MDDFTLRSVNDDGTVNELAITPEQALDLGAGKPIAYFAGPENVTVDNDGTITLHSSAKP